MFGNPMLPLFAGARAAAANVSAGDAPGNYTSEMFAEDHPEFYSAGGDCYVPEAVLESFIKQANNSVVPARWGSMWRMAAGLYVAHMASILLKTYKNNSDSPSQVASAASASGIVSSARMGDTQINYDNSAITKGTEEWGAWNSTIYGQQLITYARMVGMGGSYVI